MRWIAIPISEYLEWFAKIAPGLLFVIALVAVIVALRQSGEASRARRLAATKLLLDEIGNDEVRMARLFVMEEMQEFTIEDIRTKRVDFAGDALKNARRVGVAYDRIGVMIKQGLLDERILFDSQHIEIGKIWRKIEPMVRFVRSDRDRSNYLFHFEYLATTWLVRMIRKPGRRSKTCHQS